MRRWALGGLLLVVAAVFVCVSPVLAQGGGQQTAQTQPTIHVVQRGENLFRIAQRYQTSVEAIAAANGIADPTAIEVGQRLLIPTGAGTGSIPASDQHLVQPGETLNSIALRYGTSPEELAALNNMVSPAGMFVGANLNISAPHPGRFAAERGYIHTVRRGETLYRIAATYHASIYALVVANDLSTPTDIFPGMKLLIPGGDNTPPLADLPPMLRSLEVRGLPAEVGRTIEVQVVATQSVTLSGTLLDRPLHFFLGEDGQTYNALYGIYALAVPGMYTLTLSVQDAQGTVTSLQYPLRIVDGRYSSEAITLTADLQDLLNPAIVDPERDLVAANMSGFSETGYFNGPMGLPAAAPVTSAFGTRRAYNGGAYDQFHTGADFGAPPGTPIQAPAAGVVVFSDHLSVRGLATIIDHGWGVYTGYWHQSESFVQVGQRVDAGMIIGKSGNSGRSTGPHLHWEMWVNGVEVDPLQWARESFP